MLLWIRDRGKVDDQLCVQNYPPPQPPTKTSCSHFSAIFEKTLKRT